MVTFNDILDAFNEYRRHECKQTWDVLWVASNECMTKLIKASVRGKRIPDDELFDMVNSAVCNIMERFKVARFADLSWVSSRFHLQRGAALTAHVRMVKKRENEDGECVESVAVNILQIPCHKEDFF